MLKLLNQNKALVLMAGGGFFVLYVLNKYFNKASDSVIGQGLQHPIEALGALAGSVVGIEPKVSGGTQLNENFSYYIQLNGGIDKYLQQQRAGTFTGAPYDSGIDYKKQFQSKALFAFFL